MSDIKDLGHQSGLKKLKELAEAIDFCMFCTNLTAAPFECRPMSTQEVDKEGNIWFLSAASSHKNLEIKRDDKVQLLYASNADSRFLSVYGKAVAFRDIDKIDDMWNNFAKAWFKKGKYDPDITVIKVTPEEAYYWDTKDGKMITLLKIGVSAVTGITMDDGGIEGELHIR